MHGGVRVLKLRSDGKTVLSGGADGFVCLWRLEKIEDCSKNRGVQLVPQFEEDEETGPNRFQN